MFQLSSLNKIFNSEGESFLKKFKLTHKGDPIFAHKFTGSDSNVLLLGSNQITIKNHFYVTGEKIEYRDVAGNGQIGIQHGVNGVGAATTLPSDVYVIKVDEDHFKVAATKALALSNSPIGLTTVGSGTTHTFSAIKENSKAIISLDNVIQSPLYNRVGGGTTLAATIPNREVLFWDAQGYSQNDLIKIGNEVMRIQTVGFGGIANNVLVDRAWLGTNQETHAVGDSVQKVYGDYNILGDMIHFADVPYGGNRQKVGVSSINFDLANDNFTVLTELISTGDKVKLRSLNPPAPLSGNADYFLIKNGPNNFSFAADRANALIGTKINLTSAGIGTHNLLFADVLRGSSFQGRTFIRSDYTGNQVFDDIANQFTGIGKTFTLKKDGANTVGVSTDYGAVLINNVFQQPDTDYEFVDSPSPGITSVTFTGNAIAGFSERYSTSNVNANRLPRKGIIADIANTNGFGYQFQTVGIITAKVSAAGTVSSVSLGYTGTGYRGHGLTVPKFRIVGGESVTAAGGTFSVVDGSIKQLFLDDGGSGYYIATVTDAAYNHLTGLTTVTTSANHGLSTGDRVQLQGIGYTCTYSGSKTITNAKYDNNSGIMTVTTATNHGLGVGSGVVISGLGMTCQLDNGASTKTYPRTTDPYYAGSVIISKTAQTFTIQVGPSTVPTYYKTGGRSQGTLLAPRPYDKNAQSFQVTVVDNTKFQVNAGTTTAHHWYNRGGLVHKPFNVSVDAPVAYDDMKLISGSTGIGASVTVKIGVGSSIEDMVITNTGYGYTVGEKLSVAGILTDSSAGTNFVATEFTVNETQDDEFAAWIFGKLQILDDFSDEFDGRKTQFTLKENNKAVSIEKDSGSPISLDDVLLIFLDDILQKPVTSYTFDGGTQIKFTEAPKAGSKLQVLFYRGTDADISSDTAIQEIKKGDSLKINSSPQMKNIVAQDKRIVREIISRDTLQTTLYKGQGITNTKSPLRPVTWCKQRDDLFVDGVKVSKARDVYGGRVFPSAKIIKDVSVNDTVVYADSGSLIFSKAEAPDVNEFAIKIIDGDKNNTGFGTTGFTNPIVTKESVTVSGDTGSIVGIGSTVKGIQFEFYIPLDSPLRENQYGGLTKTGISTGDYFIVNRSNVGAGVTAKSGIGTNFETVGITTQFLDGVYQVSHLTQVGSGQTMRVHVEIEKDHGLNFTGLTSGVGAYYGSYSWTKFTTGTVGFAFTTNTQNGLIGLSTAANIVRSTKLLQDYT
tara:strand:+ start:6528 stop:10223 length:3696 start_codon:yes stop_codon:yes gene_type:complete